MTKLKTKKKLKIEGMDFQEWLQEISRIFKIYFSKIMRRILKEIEIIAFCKYHNYFILEIEFRIL
jgi:hypothetical protein